MTQEEKYIEELGELMKDFPDIRSDFPADMAICVIGTIQLASRHPTGRFSFSVKEAVRFARALQDHMDSIRPGIGRLLEKGWHEVYDTRREK